MATHDKAEYQILLDSASRYIVTHASSAGMTVLPPVWDNGSRVINTSMHRVRIATRDAEEELPIPHEWLPVDSEGHNRFRTEVEAALSRLRSRHRTAG